MAAPTITAVSPALGPKAGGTLVTVTGTGFAEGLALSFGDGYGATEVTVLSATRATCLTPAVPDAGLVQVYGKVGGEAGDPGGSFRFTEGAAPELHCVAPTGGPAAGGTALTLRGARFLAGATVSIGGAAATGVTVVSDTQITCTAPAGTLGSGAIVVTSDSQTSSESVVYVYLPTRGGLPEILSRAILADAGAAAIRAALAAYGDGYALFAGAMPEDAPTPAILIQESGGEDVGTRGYRALALRGEIQVLGARGLSLAATRDVAMAIWAFLDRADLTARCAEFGWTWTDTECGPPAALTDPLGMPGWSLPVTLTVEEP